MKWIIYNGKEGKYYGDDRITDFQAVTKDKL